MMPQAMFLGIGKFHEDDRAQRLLDIFGVLSPNHHNGQLNVSIVNSTRHIVAWHAHALQTDYWICLKGSLKIGLAEPNVEFLPAPTERNHTVRFEYLSDKNFRVLKIPPGVYHGYRALEPGTILLYFLTHKYDPDDEIRAKVGDFNEEWDTKNK